MTFQRIYEMKERLYFKYIFKKSHTIIHSTGTITTTTDGNAINYDVTTQTINRCSNQHEPKWRKSGNGNRIVELFSSDQIYQKKSGQNISTGSKMQLNNCVLSRH